MNKYTLTHLRELEAEAIHIIREVAAEFENPVMLYSIGKNRAHKGEAARLFLLTIFEAEGPTSDVSIEGRRALSSILFA